VESTIYWLTAVAALVATWLNIQKNVSCFWIWVVTNSIWVVADLRHEIYPQAALQATYLGLAIYGVLKWRETGQKLPFER
jgi:nicotinamide riboside transporter PnuC